MNEGTLIIIIGLGMDIFGAILVIGPIRNGRNMAKRLLEFFKETDEYLKDRKEGKPEEITPQTNKVRIDKLTNKINDQLLEELKGYKPLLIGIGLLVFGFILQIIGNLIQNPLN